MSKPCSAGGASPRGSHPPILPMRAFQERAAINAPIQGSGCRHHPPRHDPHAGRPARRSLSARMLLQVHDELVFEAADAEVEATMAIARR